MRRSKGGQNAGPDELRIPHRVLRAVVLETLKLGDTHSGAINARLKYLLQHGIVPDRRDGGAWQRYRLRDLLEITLALQLERAFIQPLEAVSFVVQNRDILKALWGRVLAMEKDQAIAVSVDAFANMSVLSEADKAIPMRLYVPGIERSNGHLPMVHIDIGALAKRTIDSLSRLKGIHPADIEHSVSLLASSQP